MGIIRRSAKILAAIYVVLLAVVLVSIFRYDGNAPVPHTDLIVVLSGDFVPPGQMGPQTTQRVDRAVQLWQDGVAPGMLMSGGTTLDDVETVADMMKAYAIGLGVPAAAIQVETRSHSTLQNAVFSYEVLNGTPPDSITLVSQRFHLARAKLSFQWAGFHDIDPQAADLATPVLGFDLVKEPLKFIVNIARASLASGAHAIGLRGETYHWLLF